MIASKTVTASQTRREWEKEDPRPVLEFQVYPERRRGLYFQVAIYRTLPQMRKGLRNWHGRGSERRFRQTWAFTQAWRRSGYWDIDRPEQSKRCIGRLYFSLDTFTLNCTAHECLHAVMWWSQVIRLRPLNVTGWRKRAHERVAEAHGNLVSQLWKQFTTKFPPATVWGWEKWSQST